MKTIKFYIAAALLFAAVKSTNAQSTDPEFGVKAGVSFPTLRGGVSGISNQSNKMGLNAGVFARVGGDFYFQPEVNFVSFKSTYTFQGAAYEAKFRQLNVPLMVGYKLLNAEDLSLRVSAGPDLSYNLNKPAAPAGTAYKKFTAGGVVNAGVDIGGVSFDARYSLGLTSANKELDQKTGLFSVAVGFKF
ncbi:PorT family protein [Pedobacter yulinensis]|uniref:PorT family protein n=1 Tax=Pedobacter yulinensis TaxID=2126353 RepID=A0A2T3HM98_9SPHI|nr:porin family protein [Pedobacter yulinensis]PST83565.1 PorT family protein [Pedobacter yulinensis]